VTKSALEFFNFKVKVVVCGSYRREKPTCGDVDILITTIEERPVSGMLNRLVCQLEREGLLIEELAKPGVKRSGSEMYMGVCKLP